jgi:hypothetical protein
MPCDYRGGFSPDENWLCNWSTSDAFGFILGDCGPCPEPVECVEDLSGDNQVNSDDLFILLGGWGPCVGCPGDFNGDDLINTDDLFVLLGGWGPCN